MPHPQTALVSDDAPTTALLRPAPAVLARWAPRTTMMGHAVHHDAPAARTPAAMRAPVTPERRQDWSARATVSPRVRAPRRGRRVSPPLAGTVGLAVVLLGMLTFQRHLDEQPLPVGDHDNVAPTVRGTSDAERQATTAVDETPAATLALPAVLPTGGGEGPRGGGRIRIWPRISGTVLSVDVVEGQAVRAGDVLFTLDPTDQARAVDLEQAGLQERQAQLRQVLHFEAAAARALLEGRGLPGDLQDAANAVAIARARVKGAVAAKRIALDRIRSTRVLAPCDGKIAARFIQPGEPVVAGTSAANGSEPPLVLVTNEMLVIQGRIPADGPGQPSLPPRRSSGTRPPASPFLF
jgi:multidrug efflux pump subunit AcrA (membrane-fusion protein)